MENRFPRVFMMIRVFINRGLLLISTLKNICVIVPVSAASVMNSVEFRTAPLVYRQIES